jgi:hypothetical protein
MKKLVTFFLLEVFCRVVFFRVDKPFLLELFHPLLVFDVSLSEELELVVSF